MGTPTIIVPGAAPAVSFSQSDISTAADINMSSGSYTRLDASLRVTATIGASGTAIVRQALSFFVPNGGDVFSGVSIDGGAYTGIGGVYTVVAGTDGRTMMGEYVATGLSPGSHTFDMGYQGSGSCNVHSYAALAAGTWQSVEPL